MTPAQAARAIGCKSLRQVSEVSGVPVSTLRDWFVSRRFVFSAVCSEVVRVTEVSPMSMVGVTFTDKQRALIESIKQQEQQQ